MGCTIVEQGVRCQSKGKDVVQPVRRINRQAFIGLQPDPDAMRATGEAVNPLARRRKGIIGNTEAFGKPKVHTRLVAKFDGRCCGKLLLSIADVAVFRVVARIGIEIEKVDILDAVHVGTPGQTIPDLIVDGTRD
jgi:hypothetical protein